MCFPAVAMKIAFTVGRSSGAVFIASTVSSIVATAAVASKTAKASHELSVNKLTSLF